MATAALAAAWAAGAALSRAGTGTGRYPTEHGVDTALWALVRTDTGAWALATRTGDRYVAATVALGAAAALAAVLPARERLRALAVPAALLVAGVTAQLVAKPVLGRHIAAGVDAYPSGHATGTAAVLAAACLTLPPGRLRALAAAGIAWPLAAGLGMAASGSHYPTDVLAGWVWGAAWAVLVVDVARRLVPGAGRWTRISAGASPGGSRCSSSPRSPGGSC